MKFQTKSYWLSTPHPSRYPTLKSNSSVDVAIVGAGITGLTSALLLSEAGKTVALIDQHGVATGESGHTTAHITEAVDTRYHSIDSQFGREASQLLAQSSRAAIEQIAEWVDRFEISCDFLRVPGYLYSQNRKDFSELKKELSSAKSAGLQVQWANEIPFPFETQFKPRGAICFENQAQFHPRKYLLALAERISGNLCHIFEKTRALDIEDGEPCKVTTDQCTITCKDVIVATNTPISNRFILHTKIAAYRTYAVAAHVKEKPKVSALYWDNEDPYHYIRNHHHFWIIGGEDHKTGMKQNTIEAFEDLKAFVQINLGLSSTPYSWSGQILESTDGLPYIGRNPFSNHLYVATGFAGNGITFGTISGILLSDLIQGKENAWQELYNPARIKPITSASDYIYENKDFPVCFIKDRIKPADASDPSEVGKGEGKIIKRDGMRMAVSRDEKGQIHSVSAVCPHLGCIVHWNNSEQSWDCPCHGSRFSTDGEVMNGPATQGLAPSKLGTIPIKQRRRRAA